MAETTTKRWEWAHTLTFVGLALGILGILFPPGTPLALGTWVVCLLLCLVYPFLHFAAMLLPFRGGLSYSVAMLTLIAIIAVVGIKSFQNLPKPAYYHHLTQQERGLFMDTLKAQTEAHEDIKILCPAASEDLCAIATEYAEMFQRAGWKINGGGIERGEYRKSYPGISIGKRPSPGEVDPNELDRGLWVRQSPSLVSVRRAFDAIHLSTLSMAEQSLPENTISVYFGVPPS